MSAILAFLSGKKTIIGTVLLGAIGVALSLGYISLEVAGVLGSVVAVFTGVSAVAHVNKLPLE